MKPGFARSLRRLLEQHHDWTGRARDAFDARSGEGAGEVDALCDAEDAIDPVEFAEFVCGDASVMPIDPAFRERLRRRLWAMVRARTRDRGASPSARQRPRDDRPS